MSQSLGFGYKTNENEDGTEEIINDIQEIINKLDKKCTSLGLDKNNYLEGLLHTKPITYWDYIQLNSLLGLQIQKTNYKDEMVFIVYHQINELIFKMILWELQQVAEETILKVSFVGYQ